MSAFLSPILAYWQARTGREQIMLGVMGLLIIALLLTVAVIRPLRDYHASARTDYAASMQLYRSVQTDARTYRDLAAGASQQASQAQQSLRAVVGATALRHDIALARMVPTEDGGLTITIERAPGQSVMGLLVDLEEQYSISVMSASLDREPGNTVSASILLRRAGGA
ncbi:type II secretion system protein M [Maricaulis parjimensis]|uniref:type II secretion system protein M n=1 Tax=Maricaulis parjimensis TaxID=144023 RepID=UPI0019394DEC|nr:type II secretion system protein M [Maricaulis parjimensis]